MLWSQTTLKSQGSYQQRFVLLMLCIHCWLAGVGCCSMLSSSSLWTAVWNIACHLGRAVSALESLAWHCEMPWPEARYNTPAHNPMTRAVCWALPSAGGQGSAMCSEVRDRNCLVSSTYGHHTMVTLQSSVSKWTSSRSCFMLAISSASLNLHIWQYWIKHARLFSGDVDLKWSRHLNLAEQWNKTRRDLHLINSAVACPGVC